MANRSPTELAIEAVQALSAVEARMGAVEQALLLLEQQHREVGKELAGLKHSSEVIADQARREQDRADRAEQSWAQALSAIGSGFSDFLRSYWIQVAITLIIATWLGISADRLLPALLGGGQP